MKKKIEFSKINYYLPYPEVYCGEYIDGYSKSENDDIYICSCYKKALKNKLLMFEDYFKYDNCLNDRRELLCNFLGIPEYYEKIIKENDLKDKYVDYLDIFKFEDELCPICNNLVAHDMIMYWKNKGSNFKQENSHEIEKRNNEIGILSKNLQDEFYALKSVLPKEYNKVLYPNDQEILKELKKEERKYDITEEYKKYKNLPYDIKLMSMEGLIFDRKGHIFKDTRIANDYNVSIDLLEDIWNIRRKRYKSIQQEITESIREYNKQAADPKFPVPLVGGAKIFLFNEDYECDLLLGFYYDALIIETFYRNHKTKRNEYKFDLEGFSYVVKLLSSSYLLDDLDTNSYKSFIITNDKDERTEEDIIRGDYTSGAIWLLSRYLLDEIKLKEKDIKILLDFFPNINED